MPGANSSSFVGDLVAFCTQSTIGREPSHGVEHMSKVRENSECIFDAMVASDPQLFTPHVRKMVQAVAQFHDIADHKYVADPGSCGIQEELSKYFSEQESAVLMKAIDAVSYSKELKLRKATENPCEPVDFVELLQQGDHFALVRDIVSDADKLEAIGSIGVQRCIAYTKEAALKKSGTEPPPEIILQHLVEHGEEKLFILYAHRYIRTSAGRKLAEPLQQVMLDEVAVMLGEDTQTAFRLQQQYGIQG